MNRFARSILAVFVLRAVGGTAIATAQDTSDSHMPPKVLVMGREYTKPEKPVPLMKRQKARSYKL